MIPAITPNRLQLCLLIFLCVLLQGCAQTGKPESKIKIGLHIDAVLEFVVEYPSLWTKDRRIVYGDKSGEVRWTENEGQDTLLKISSLFLKEPVAAGESLAEQIKKDHAAMVVTRQETVDLPAGEALHITGQAANTNIAFYQISAKTRSYLISLSTPDDLELYKDLMARVIHSFRMLPEKNHGQDETKDATQ